MKIETTSRGFQIVNFTDHNGVSCSLQQSSAIDLSHEGDEGSSYVWLGCDKNAAPHMGHEMSPRMHLNRQQVGELVTHLQAWLETGEFYESDCLTVKPNAG
jgi:hypothetical protein